MGRRGPKEHSKESRRAISDGVRRSTRFRESVDARQGHSLETRARQAASKTGAERGTLYWRLEYEMALERLGMLRNQALRRRAFFKQHSDPNEPDTSTPAWRSSGAPPTLS